MTYRTSLYLSEIGNRQFPNIGELKGIIKAHILNMYKNSITENDFGLSFKGFIFRFRINYVAEAKKKIILTFFPYKDKTITWYKEKCSQSVNNTLQFCDLLGETLTFEGTSFTFQRVVIQDTSFVDMKNWKITLLCSDQPRFTTLQDYLNYEKVGEFLGKKYDIKEFFSEKGFYAQIFKTLPANNVFYPFSKDYSDNSTIVQDVKAFLDGFGQFEQIRNPQHYLEFFQTLHDKKESIFIFIEKKDRESWYNNNRKLFYSNCIPTQLIIDDTFQKKLQYPGVRANLLLEMLTKMGKKPLVLKIPQEIDETDGFLCLSDLQDVKEKMFGALITYSKGIEKEGKLQIYRGIDYSTKYDIISFPRKEKLDELIEKIAILAEADSPGKGVPYL